MEEKEIIEGNKLIADFMGLRLENDRFFPEVWVEKKTGDWRIKGRLDYHKDWSSLMPLVEKISRIEFERRYDQDEEKWVIWTHYPVTFGMLDEQGRPMVRFYCNTLHFGDTLIDATWNAVVDFLKSYDSNSKQIAGV